MQSAELFYYLLVTLSVACSGWARSEFDSLLDGLKAQRRNIDYTLGCTTQDSEYQLYSKTLFRQSVLAALDAIELDQAFPSQPEEGTTSTTEPSAESSSYSETAAVVASISSAISADACEWLKSSMHLGESFNCSSDDVIFFKTLLEMHNLVSNVIYKPLRDNCSQLRDGGVVETSCFFPLNEETQWLDDRNIERTNANCSQE